MTLRSLLLISLVPALSGCTKDRLTNKACQIDRDCGSPEGDFRCEAQTGVCYFSRETRFPVALKLLQTRGHQIRVESPQAQECFLSNAEIESPDVRRRCVFLQRPRSIRLSDPQVKPLAVRSKKTSSHKGGGVSYAGKHRPPAI